MQNAEARRGPVAIVALIAASASLLLAVLTHGWLVNNARRLKFGLLSLDSDGDIWANHAVVASARASGHQSVSSLFVPTGVATLALGVISAAILLAMAVAPRKWLATIAQLVLGIALVTAIAFLATKPTGPAFGVDAGWSAWLFAGAVGAGVVGSRISTRG